MKRLSPSVAAVVALLSIASAAQTVPSDAPAAPAVQPAAPAAQPLPAARWTAEQIREAFDMADSNSNGEISRTEAQRLAILPRSFEDMDANKDGVLVRAEYEAAFPR